MLADAWDLRADPLVKAGLAVGKIKIKMRRSCRMISNLLSSKAQVAQVASGRATAPQHANGIREIQVKYSPRKRGKD